MKKYLALVVLLVAVFVLAGCKEKYQGLDKDVTGEVTILLWSGDGVFHEDIGKQNLTKDDLVSQNTATIYAVAKEFNKVYPNVKVNVMAKVGGPADGGTTWDQFKENFTLETGKTVDIWASTNLVDDVTRGLVADLSVFKDDPMYKSFNPGVMQMMNYYGIQAGLPQYLLPWGVYVNKSLADQKNIDVPEPNWTIEEYTDFVSNSQANVFYGSMDTPKSFIFTGTNTMAKQLLQHKAGEDFINMNSAEVRALIPYIAEWSEHSVWPQWDKSASTEVEENSPMRPFMNANGWWSFNFFKNGALLTLDGDPWMLGDAANQTPGHWGTVQAEEWDIYPRPSTPYMGNSVGIVLDPLAIHNYALEDSNPELSDAEYAKLQLSYTFASFWIGDDASWEARKNQEFKDGETYKTAINDSFPTVTGKAFERQMEIWFQAPTHQYFADKTKTPGFHKLMEVFEKGEFFDVSDKAYPWTYDNNGTKSEILREWNNFNLPDVLTGTPGATSPRRTDAGFTDMVLSKLAGWNTLANERFLLATTALQQGLITHYGMKAADFE